MARWSAWALGLGALAVSVPAWAETTQPNGLEVPRPSNVGPNANDELQLSDLFTAEGETIDFVADGFPTPDTFSPLCGFKATFVMHQASNRFALAWYNVDPESISPPPANELYEILAEDAVLDETFMGANIIADPNYKGGLIGFALMTNPPHYSEKRFNPYCPSGTCSTPGNWILSISYKSIVNPNAYYLAFEDGDTTAASFSNDGDYNDDVFFLEGLACAGDGEPCMVPGAQGVCVSGITVCNNTGALVCQQINQESAEKCDGLDNDCDGTIDGPGLCGVGNVCSRGVCVPFCGVGEFECTQAPYTACEEGVCVEPECVGKSCEDGEICVKGECRSACQGVSCPFGQECRLGVCVDPCAGITCESPRVCQGGACVLDCTCKPCAAGSTCQPSGVCVDDDCKDVTCGEGEYCAADGTCTDACKDAMCPSGSMCEKGQCVPSPMVPPSTEVDGGTVGTGDGDGDGDGTGDGDGDGTLDSGTGSLADAGAGGGPGGGNGEGVVKDDAGCGCRVPFGREGSSRALAMSALLALGVFARRRRR